MSLKIALITVVACAAWLGSPTVTLADTADQRPFNVVFVLADDKYVLGDCTPRECLERPQILGDLMRSSRCGESR